MKAVEKEQLSASAAQLKVVLPLVIAACALLAAWFGWSGWQLHSDGVRRLTITELRNDVVAAAQESLAAEQKQLGQRLAAPTMQSALAAGDLAAATQQLGQGWAGAVDAVVLAPDLRAEYAALPKGGYGRMGVIEAALAAGKPVAGLVRQGGGAQLALAAPVRMGEQLVGVAYVRLPLQKISAALEQADVSDQSYLALRQGGFSAVERGDTALAGGAEALASKVPGSDLRVAAAVPDVAGGPFGLDALTCFVVAGMFALLALLAWRAPHFKLARRNVASGEEGPVQTLAESIEQTPPIVKAAPVPTAKPMQTQPVAIDRGIFRAYDIRGVVGQIARRRRGRADRPCHRLADA